MLRTLKYLFFALISLFLISVSSAEPRLYYVQKKSQRGNPWIRACYISAIDGNLDPARCRTVYRDADKRPNAVVISDDNKKGYISSETGGVLGHGTVLTCKVTSKKADLKECQDIGYNFNNPQGMVMDSIGRLYITESGDGIVTVCNYPEESNPGLGCTPASRKLEGGPNSIALNPNGGYAYITVQNTNKLYVCKIDKEDPLGRFETCVDYRGYSFNAPGSVAIDPTGKFLYVVNRALVSGAGQNAFNCRLTDSGDEIIDCKGSQVGALPSYSHTMSIAVFPERVFPDASVGYVIDSNYIYLCLLSNNRPPAPFTYSCGKQPIDTISEHNLYSLFLYPH